MLLQEGENFTTYCNSSSILSSLQWYKQRPGGSPVLLMILAKGGEAKMQQRWAGRLGESRQQSSLHLMAAQLSDARTYFWARAQCSGSTCCLSPNLTVGSRGCSSSSLLRAGARESWSHDIYEEIEFLIKNKSPDSVSLKNSVKHWSRIILAWRIPGTGEAGGLPSMGSHRVGHDWSDLATYTVSCRQ